MLAFASMAVAVAGSGCGTALLSARSPLLVIPESQEAALGIRVYEQVVADEPTSANEQLVAVVNRVGQRLAAAADKPQFDWEFRVIDKEEMHAFALPGGKVAVSEGFLSACQDEAGLAVALSHEMAHVLARHGSERISRPPVDAGLRGAVQAIARPTADAVTASEIMRAYGAAPKSGETLPYSRKHEAEADAIGLILMAKAGYDPSAAPEFWERLSRSSGSDLPQWISTHPADGRRTAQLRAMLPVAMNYYRAAPEQFGLGDELPIPDQSQRSLASAASGPREGELEQAALTSPVSPHVLQGVARDTSRGFSPDKGVSQETSSGLSQAASQQGSQEAKTKTLNDWVAGSESPQTPSVVAAKAVARVRSEDRPSAWSVPQTDADVPAARVPDARSTKPASASDGTAAPSAPDDDFFYPPIAVSNTAGRTSAPFQLPSRRVPSNDESWQADVPQ